MANKSNKIYLKIYLECLSAHIICGKTKLSQLLVTKHQARALVMTLFIDEIITHLDWSALDEEIDRSPLIEESNVLEQMSVEFQGKLDELKYRMERFVHLLEEMEDENEDGPWRRN